MVSDLDSGPPASRGPTPRTGGSPGAARQARLALGRQLEPLGGAAEQDDAQRILERADLLADRRRRDREFVGRTGEGEMPRRRVEHAQAVERKMGPLHPPPPAPGARICGMSTSNAAVLAEHVIAALHRSGRRRQRAARDIIEAAPGLRSAAARRPRLRPRPWRAPRPSVMIQWRVSKLHRHRPLILDADMIGPEPAPRSGSDCSGR
jgi:hypothetical protein